MRQRYALDFGPNASTGERCCVSSSKHILRRIRNPATEIWACWSIGNGYW